MPETFCQICKHPTDIGLGHYASCPVLTGAPVQGVSIAGMAAMTQQQQQGSRALDQQQQSLRAYQIHPGVLEDGYEVAKIYRDARTRIIEELKIQVEINHRLSRELMDMRMELKVAQDEIQDLNKIVADLSKPPIDAIDDSCPF